MTEAEIRENMKRRVRYGAEFLDRTRPNWYKVINLPSLDMNFENSCIAGQLEMDSLVYDDSYGFDSTNEEEDELKHNNYEFDGRRTVGR